MKVKLILIFYWNSTPYQLQRKHNHCSFSEVHACVSMLWESTQGGALMQVIIGQQTTCRSQISVDVFGNSSSVIFELTVISGQLSCSFPCICTGIPCLLFCYCLKKTNTYSLGCYFEQCGWSIVSCLEMLGFVSSLSERRLDKKDLYWYWRASDWSSRDRDVFHRATLSHNSWLTLQSRSCQMCFCQTDLGVSWEN